MNRHHVECALLLFLSSLIADLSVSICLQFLRRSSITDNITQSTVHNNVQFTVDFNNLQITLRQIRKRIIRTHSTIRIAELSWCICPVLEMSRASKQFVTWSDWSVYFHIDMFPRPIHWKLVNDAFEYLTEHRLLGPCVCWTL